MNVEIRLKVYPRCAVIHDKGRDSNLRVFGRERSRWLSSRRRSFFGKDIDMKLLSYILTSFNGTTRSFPGTDLL